MLNTYKFASSFMRLFYSFRDVFTIQLIVTIQEFQYLALCILSCLSNSVDGSTIFCLFCLQVYTTHIQMLSVVNDVWVLFCFGGCFLFGGAFIMFFGGLSVCRSVFLTKQRTIGLPFWLYALLLEHWHGSNLIKIRSFKLSCFESVKDLIFNWIGMTRERKQPKAIERCPSACSLLISRSEDDLHRK